jgi:hypothetical protein
MYFYHIGARLYKKWLLKAISAEWLGWGLGPAGVGPLYMYRPSSVTETSLIRGQLLNVAIAVPHFCLVAVSVNVLFRGLCRLTFPSTELALSQ